MGKWIEGIREDLKVRGIDNDMVRDMKGTRGKIAVPTYAG